MPIFLVSPSFLSPQHKQTRMPTQNQLDVFWALCCVASPLRFHAANQRFNNYHCTAILNSTKTHKNQKLHTDRTASKKVLQVITLFLFERSCWSIRGSETRKITHAETTFWQRKQKLRLMRVVSFSRVYIYIYLFERMLGSMKGPDPWLSLPGTLQFLKFAIFHEKKTEKRKKTITPLHPPLRYFCTGNKSQELFPLRKKKLHKPKAKTFVWSSFLWSQVISQITPWLGKCVAASEEARFKGYRWVPLYPNMLKSKLAFIRRYEVFSKPHLNPCCVILHSQYDNGLNQRMSVILFVSIKRDPPVSGQI